MSPLKAICAALAAEWRGLELRGPRGSRAARAATAVLLAILAALATGMDDVWMAAIAAYIVTQANLRGSLAFSVMRIIGGGAGALLGVGVTALFIDDLVPLCTSLFVLGTVALLGAVTSRYVLAWLLGGLIAVAVILGSLEDPSTAVLTGATLAAENAIGVTVSLAVAICWPEGRFMPEPDPGDWPWADIRVVEIERWLADRWPAVLYAVRGGITVALLPLVAPLFVSIGLGQVGITSVAVMAVPPGALVHHDADPLIRRAAHRAVGCGIGAVLGLFCLTTIGAALLPSLLAIGAAVWLGSQVQTGPSGISYLGMQAVVAFLITVVQGRGPALSLDPGLDRLAGIVIGLGLLLVVSLLLPGSGNMRTPAD